MLAIRFLAEIEISCTAHRLALPERGLPKLQMRPATVIQKLFESKQEAKCRARPVGPEFSCGGLICCACNNRENSRMPSRPSSAVRAFELP